MKSDLYHAREDYRVLEDQMTSLYGERIIPMAIIHFCTQMYSQEIYEVFNAPGLEFTAEQRTALFLVFNRYVSTAIKSLDQHAFDELDLERSKHILDTFFQWAEMYRSAPAGARTN